MRTFLQKILFALTVTAVMNALDMTYHLATGWAVHLNYVAIKLTVIFLAVWMITQFIGLGKQEGIITSIFAPFMFYVYYVFAGATLNREIFKIDEQFWFYFLHAGLLLIAYFSAWNFLHSKQQWKKTTGFIITAGFTSIAFHALLLMTRWRIAGMDEETAATLFTFSVILLPIIAYFIGIIAGTITQTVFRKRILSVGISAIIPATILFISTREIGTSVFTLLFVLLSYYIIHTFKKGLEVIHHE